ncbi:MAG: hypothetical protein P8185_04195 [Deltaproteobacteria bacterium]|jgi:hypothetical protein
MEANEIICPQCGLANNELAESCVQCGIIFIKKPAMSTHTIQDDRKIKAIEEAEAMLNGSQAPEDESSGNDAANRPDSHEDTLEMQIPEEEKTDIKREAESTGGPKPAEQENMGHQEIEMEAIEATMEAVDGMVDAEALFLTDVSTAKSAETATQQAAQQEPGWPIAAEKENDQSGEALNSKADKEGSRNLEADDLPVRPLAGDNSMDGSRKEENRKENELVEAKAEAGETAETETAVTEIVEPTNNGDHAMPADIVLTAEQEIQSEEKVEATAANAAPGGAPISMNATIEMPIELAEEPVRADHQVEKAKQNALKKQQETQAKAEALEKEKAAQAAAMKKKKLARAQAEALKKQKAAQAKAEALKKRKEARAKARASKNQGTAQARVDALKKQREAQERAEASAQEVQCAGSCQQLAAAANMNHYERLLGLLKRYKGKAIGINYDNSSEIREAELVDANEEFFSVRVKDKKLQYSYPLNTILTIVEGQEGVEAGEGDKKARFDAVIKVYPLVLS